MGLRPHRRNLVVWSSSGTPGIDRAPRSARGTRIRWWLRVAALLMVIGVMRLGRAARARWEPMSLLAGGALTVTGFVEAAAGIFFLGMLVLIVGLLAGIRGQRRGRTPPG